LFIPTGNDALGAFAASFKTWCFGYDPATGRIEVAYLVMMMVNPLILSGLVFVVWNVQIRELWSTNRSAFLNYGVATFLTVIGLGSLILFLNTGAEQGEIPFPAESLRTEHRAPQFSFTNQDGTAVDLNQLKGNVVLLTGVYATCSYTCPMIMGQAKNEVARLSERERDQLRIIGITLDPDRDDQEMLKIMATGQQVSAPLFNLVTGAPDEINQVLDFLNIARRKDPVTGIIDHVNLFILVDRNGKIAYRFSLGKQQEEWLVKALKLLLSEQTT